MLYALSTTDGNVDPTTLHCHLDMLELLRDSFESPRAALRRFSIRDVRQ